MIIANKKEGKMNEEEQMLATTRARVKELWELRDAFQVEDNKPSQEWMIECIAGISFLVEEVKQIETRADLFVTLALGMWQAGYEAAPKMGETK